MHHFTLVKVSCSSNIVPSVVFCTTLKSNGKFSSERVSMGLSVWRETSKKLTVCREKGKKLTVCRELFCPDNRVVCSFS